MLDSNNCLSYNNTTITLVTEYSIMDLSSLSNSGNFNNSFTNYIKTSMNLGNSNFYIILSPNLLS